MNVGHEALALASEFHSATTRGDPEEIISGHGVSAHLPCHERRSS
jgi:hypothetical protein